MPKPPGALAVEDRTRPNKQRPGDRNENQGDGNVNYKELGRTGVKVSELCFGTMSFGGDADEGEAARMFAACRDLGINFFDCADGYSKGRAETILGKLMAEDRDELVITSKCFVPMADDINARGGNRRHILRAVEASLERLGTDRLDVLFMHRWDPVVPLEETLRALDKLVADGKVLYLGASNYAAWQIAKGLGIAEKNGWQAPGGVGNPSARTCRGTGGDHLFTSRRRLAERQIRQGQAAGCRAADE
jgi:aryl-alcohol dehydrogenase-like predicted oxidoreductase